MRLYAEATLAGRFRVQYSLSEIDRSTKESGPSKPCGNITKYEASNSNELEPMARPTPLIQTESLC